MNTHTLHFPRLYPTAQGSWLFIRSLLHSRQESWSRLLMTPTWPDPVVPHYTPSALETHFPLAGPPPLPLLPRRKAPRFPLSPWGHSTPRPPRFPSPAAFPDSRLGFLISYSTPPLGPQAGFSGISPQASSFLIPSINQAKEPGVTDPSLSQPGSILAAHLLQLLTTSNALPGLAALTSVFVLPRGHQLFCLALVLEGR